MGWEYFDKACYFFNHTASINYEEAGTACTSMDAQLTSINSAEEQDFVAGIYIFFKTFVIYSYLIHIRHYYKHIHLKGNY